MREQVMSGRAGAVALNVSEFGRSSTFRERLLVFGGTERGDFLLPYRRVSAAHLQFWRRASEKMVSSVSRQRPGRTPLRSWNSTGRNAAR